MSLSEPLVSIVVPVYNVERYLARSIQSIKNQTYHNLQIILIDDGATDSSGTICDVQATTDNRIEVFHSENQGVAEARNLGLKHVRGEYLIFVDPDDFVGPTTSLKLSPVVQIRFSPLLAARASITTKRQSMHNKAAHPTMLFRPSKHSQFPLAAQQPLYSSNIHGERYTKRSCFL